MKNDPIQVIHCSYIFQGVWSHMIALYDKLSITIFNWLSIWMTESNKVELVSAWITWTESANLSDSQIIFASLKLPRFMKKP